MAGLVAAALLFAGCTSQTETEMERFSGSFYDTFDTVVQLVAFAEDQEAFDEYMEALKTRFTALHKEFDNYNAYDGVNNIYTVNEKAGQEPVQVNEPIIELLEQTRERYDTLSEKTDISNGALYAVWHDHREMETPTVPEQTDLEAAAAHSGMEHIIIDREAGTVMIDDPKVQIDLGAVAKGYATEVAAKELEAMGLTSGIINSGGNVRTIGKPLDGREHWGIGIQNPDYLLGESSEENAEVLYVSDQSVVTSGDYQRFFTVDEEVYHHLIDPDTLFPATHMRAVSVVTQDSGLADFLSTAVFLMPYEEGRALIDSVEGAEALWITKEGDLLYTEGMKQIAYSQGAGATE